MIAPIKSNLRQFICRLSPRIREHFFRKEHVEWDTIRHFDRTRCIFTHIPKCAGISIVTQLYGCEIDHHKASTWFESYPHSARRYFTFTIVRRPTDRFISAYNFLKAGGLNENDSARARLLEPYPTVSSLAEALNDPRQRTAILNILHFEPQIDYVTDGQSPLPLNLIIPLENLAEGLAIVSRETGISLSASRHLNRSQPLDGILSPAAIAAVEAAYAKDVALHAAALAEFQKRSHP